LALIGIAQVYGQLKDEAAAQKVLKLALKVTEEINILKVQFPVLIGIAQVYGQLKDEAAAQEVLKLALKVTEEIKDSDDQFLALREVSRVYGQLKDKAAAQEILKSALKVTEEIDDSESQSLVLREIAEVSAQETNLEVAQAILHDVLLTAETVNDSSILEKIAVQYAQQSAWGKALRALKNCPESLKVSALAQILTLWAEKNNPKLMNGAVVEELNVKGTPQNYTFDVTIYSPDRDCDYYADWWEVLDEEGNLLYRKVFQKQHVDKQPFKSIGEYINIKSDQVVIVRAHMHTNSSNDTGYEAKQVWIGSVDKGFEFIRLSENFAKNVAKEDPQPPTCQASVQ
ncbi:MAG: tetratricopeptide repeat protein, partial [Cyanobacteria bacterium P01_F01_bin.143]